MSSNKSPTDSKKGWLFLEAINVCNPGAVFFILVLLSSTISPAKAYYSYSGKDRSGRSTGRYVGRTRLPSSSTTFSKKGVYGRYRHKPSPTTIRQTLVGPNVCGPKCCRGWMSGNTAMCIRAICTSPCKNGGYCVQPELCLCPSLHTGNDCSTKKSTGTRSKTVQMMPKRKRGPRQTIVHVRYQDETQQQSSLHAAVVCTPATCFNGGTCVDGSCICRKGYEGKKCEKVVVVKMNLNSVLPGGSAETSPADQVNFKLCNALCVHGTCAVGAWPVCQCHPGYYGAMCESSRHGRSKRKHGTSASRIRSGLKYNHNLLRPMAEYSKTSSRRISVTSPRSAVTGKYGKCYRTYQGKVCGLSYTRYMTAESCCRTGLGDGWGQSCIPCRRFNFATTVRAGKITKPTVQCPKGFTRLNGICKDINECLVKRNVCENGACVNSRGSYWCKCNRGFSQHMSRSLCLPDRVTLAGKVSTVAQDLCYLSLDRYGGCRSGAVVRGKKSVCCCSVGLAWGPSCEKCPVRGTAEHAALCPSGSGYFKTVSYVSNLRRPAKVPDTEKNFPSTSTRAPFVTPRVIFIPKKVTTTTTTKTSPPTMTSTYISSGPNTTKPKTVLHTTAKSQEITTDEETTTGTSPPETTASGDRRTTSQDKTTPTVGHTTGAAPVVTLLEKTTTVALESSTDKTTAAFTSTIDPPQTTSVEAETTQLPIATQPSAVTTSKDVKTTKDNAVEVLTGSTPSPPTSTASATTAIITSTKTPTPPREESVTLTSDSLGGDVQANLTEEADDYGLLDDYDVFETIEVEEDSYADLDGIDSGVDIDLELEHSATPVVEVSTESHAAKTSEASSTTVSEKALVEVPVHAVENENELPEMSATEKSATKAEEYSSPPVSDACSGNPCLNGGECAIQDFSFECKCTEGYFGTNCETKDYCVPDPCRNGATCETGMGFYYCDCKDGYAGRNCEIRILSCESNPCSHGTCKNTEGGYRCECERGYEGINCDGDVDECDFGVCGSNARCVNNFGSFECTCNEGYKLSSNKQSCEDVDECRNSTRCQNGRCVNTQGSYRCECNIGYILDEGGQCEDLVECDFVDCGADASCRNLPGSYECVCPDEGDIYDVTKKECFSPYPEEPEKEEVRKPCYPAPRFCKNPLSENVTREECCCTVGRSWGDCESKRSCPSVMTGAFKEMCPSGRGLTSGENFKVVDLNECELFGSEKICQNGECTNSFGGYKCTCFAGFYYNRRIQACDDINECRMRSKCIGGFCINLKGSFKCHCPPGTVLRTSGYLSTCTSTQSQRRIPGISRYRHNARQPRNKSERSGSRDFCFKHVMQNSMCSVPLPIRYTYEECCCFRGIAWGSSCSTCPRRHTTDYRFLCNDRGTPRASKPPVRIEDAKEEPDSTVSGEFHEQRCEIAGGCENGKCLRAKHGYTCECNDGYRLDAAQTACEDINECEELKHACLNGVCLNQPGAFRCICRAGYEPLRSDPTVCKLDHLDPSDYLDSSLETSTGFDL